MLKFLGEATNYLPGALNVGNVNIVGGVGRLGSGSGTTVRPCPDAMDSPSVSSDSLRLM